MNPARSRIRWDRIDSVRRRMKGGFYSDTATERGLLAGCMRDLMRDLKRVEIGPEQATIYRDLAAEVFMRGLRSILDFRLARKEFGAEGGRGDIELPLRKELLDRYPLLSRWAAEFQVSSLILEVKNSKVASGPSDVSQVRGYLGSPGLGRLAVLASHSGFSKKARNRLSELAYNDHILIIPLAHADLCALVRARNATSFLEILRTKETLLLQHRWNPGR